MIMETTTRNCTVWDGKVSGLASCTVYDFSGHATTLGRYAIAKRWKDVRGQFHTRQSNCHQRAAAIGRAVKWLESKGVVVDVREYPRTGA